MSDLLNWYIAVLVLGLAALPLTWLALAHLPDRGWSLTKPIAVLLVGVGCWLPATLIPAIPFSRGWIITVALLLAATSVTVLSLRPHVAHELGTFFRRHWGYVLVSESIFASTLGVMGWLRSFAPQIQGTEQFMDEAFIASVIRAQHLPPADPWLSGHPINYYYFGHFLIGMIAKLLGTPASIAYNTGIALTAALVATAIFGLGTNLSALVLGTRKPTADVSTSAARQTTNANISLVSQVPDVNASTARQETSMDIGVARQATDARLTLAIPFGLFSVVALLVLGNLRSFGDWWVTVKDLPGAIDWLRHPALWSSYDWWSPSRALPAGTITEFPNFSFMLSDMHAHVLALPYAALALGVALNIWLAPQVKGLALFGSRLTLVPSLLVAGLALGGLYFINGWDLPTYLGIALVTLVLHQWNAHGRTLSTALGFALLRTGGVLLACCFVPYLPFLLHFTSPSQGIGLVTGAANHLAISLSAGAALDVQKLPVDPLTRSAIGDELAINGVMFFILGSWLLILLARTIATQLERDALSRVNPTADRLSGAPDDGARLSYITEQGVVVGVRALPATSTTLSSSAWLQSWGIVGGGMLFLLLVTRLSALWDGWTLVWMLLGLAAASLLVLRPLLSATSPTAEDRALAFPLLLVAVGMALIAVPELVFLRDVFAGSAPRMNTIFKLYFQVWLIFAVAAAPALAWIVNHLPDRLLGHNLAAFQPVAYLWRGVWVVVLVALVAASLIYPIGASHTIYLRGTPSTGTLDGLSTIAPYILQSGDLRALAWMRANISGDPTIVEASIAAAEYKTYGRVSVFTGLPTIMGWAGHEYQWRVNWLNDPNNAQDFNARLGDITTIYTSSDSAVVLRLLHHYDAKFIYVGPVEWATYGTMADLGRFARYLHIIYNTDGVVIYQVSPN